MKNRIYNGNALEFFNSDNSKKGEIKISGSDIIINPLDSSGTVIFGEEGTINDIEVGAAGTPVDFTFLGGGTITSNGGTLTLGNAGDTVDLSNATIGTITASIFQGGEFIGDGSGLTGVTTDLSAYTGSVNISGSVGITGNTIIAVDTPVNPIGVTGLEVYNNASQARLMIHQDDGTSDAKLSFRAGGNDTSISVPASGNGLVFDFENKSSGFVFDINGKITTPITASSNISASGELIVSDVIASNVQTLVSGGSFRIKNSGGTTIATFANGGNATITGDISSSGNLYLEGDNIYLGNNETRIRSYSSYLGLFKSGGSAQPVKAGGLTVSSDFSHGHPTNGIYSKGDISGSGDIIGFTGSYHALNISDVVNAGTDTDKFLVLDSSGNVDFRTGTEVRSDIGAGTGDGTGDITSVSGSGNVSGITLSGNHSSGDACLTLGGTFSATTSSISNFNAGVGTIVDGCGFTTGAAGSNTQVQFNNSGNFGGSSNLTFDGTNLTVGGKVIAQEIITNIVSQSISFATGSNIFGDELTDTHSFTGSILLSGSQTIDIGGRNLYFCSTGAGGWPQIDADSNLFLGGGNAGNIQFMDHAIPSGDSSIDLGNANRYYRGLYADEAFLGNDTSHVHKVTGSLNVTGSATLDGQLNITTAENQLAIFESTDQNSTVTIKDNTACTNLVHSLHAFKIQVDPSNSDGTSNFRVEIDGSEALRIKNDLNVGIGTTTPDEKLTVAGNISGSGKLYIGTTDTNTSSTSALVLNGTEVEKRTLGSNAFSSAVIVSESAQIDHDQTTNFSADEHFTQANITTVGTVTAGDVSAILPSGTVSGSSQITGFVTDGGGAVCQVGVWSSGTALSGSNDLFFDTANNRLGVGTASPNQKLTVAGSIYANGGQLFVNNNCCLAAVGNLKLVTHDGSYNTTMFLSSSGNVGVGTTTPGQKLHVSAGHILLDNNYEIRQKDSGGTQRTVFELDSSNDLNIGGSYAGALKFIGGGSYAEVMRIHDDGNVGIGTTSPAEKLTVTGNISGSGGLRLGSGTFSSSLDAVTDAAIVIPENKAIYTLSSDGNYLRNLLRKDNDIIKIGQSGTALIDEIRFLPGNAGFTSFYNETTEVARVTGSCVGIGTTSPTSKLDIVDDLSAQSTVEYPLTLAVKDDNNSIDQQGGEGVGIKFKIAGNDSSDPGNSLVGAGIAAVREEASDSDSSTGIAFLVSQNDETLDEKVRIDHDGKVGIGTNDPDYKLDVAGNAGINEYLYHNGDTNTYLRYQTDQVDIAAGGQVASLNTTGLTIPGHLTASGDISASGDITAVTASLRNINFREGGEIRDDDSGNLHLKSEDGATLSLTDTAEISSGLTVTGLSNQASEKTSLMIDGSNVVGTRELGDNAFNSTAFTTCTGTVTGTGAANKLAIWNTSTALTNDTNLHWDTSNNRLGIGTTTPGATLDVGGDISGSTKITIGSGLINSGTNTAIFGLNNTALGNYSLIAGGANCITSFSNSSIAGGIGNTIAACCSFIGSGMENCITGGYSTISSGTCNKVTAEYNFIGAGTFNTGSGACSFIGGGRQNYLTSPLSFIGGGRFNEIRCCGSSGTTGTADCSVIAGGNCNIIAGGGYGTIAGGWNNCVSASVASFIGAGAQNCIAGGYSGTSFASNHVIAGGYRNKICMPAHLQSFIGGGCCNVISCNMGVIGGGKINTVSGLCGVIGGGICNCVSGNLSGVLGGFSNEVTHDCSFIIGCNITSTATLYTFMNNACIAGTTRTVSLVETSAKKHKECVKPLQDQLDNIKKLEPIEFQWKKDKVKDIGFIAEEVEKIYPNLIAYEEDGEIHGLQYSKLTSILVKAIQEQQEQIEELKKEIFILKEKL